MPRLGIRTIIVAGLLVTGVTSAHATEIWRPAHILTTTAADLGAEPLLAPLHPQRSAARVGTDVATAARAVTSQDLSVTTGTFDAALAFTSTRMQQALATGDAWAPLDPPFSARPGTLQRPCGRAPLAAGFGPRTRIDGVTDHRHPGLSWTVDANTPAAAVAPGHVVFAGPVDGLGLVVVLAHSAFEHTVYAQLRRLAVVRDQTVSAGDVLGDAGARTPDGQRECYFEIRLDGVPVDPSPWLEPR